MKEGESMNKVKSGDTVVFDEPIEFLDGNSYKELKFIERSKFYDPISGRGYWIVSWRNHRHTIKREGK